MRVFAQFSERSAGLVKVWAKSWAARGWTPQLLSAQEVSACGSARAAARRRGGGLLADLRVINYGYPSRRCPRRRVVAFNAAGWQDALLVRFSSTATEADVHSARPV